MEPSPKLISLSVQYLPEEEKWAIVFSDSVIEYADTEEEALQVFEKIKALMYTIGTPLN